MTSSLVGSEMCIRDRCSSCGMTTGGAVSGDRGKKEDESRMRRDALKEWACLLYTSDAADDM
eukprot:12692383-Prorocentrum_lima.AAC.1